MRNYALIKNNIVENIIVFDNPTKELLDLFVQEHNVDMIIEADQYAVLEGFYVDNEFIPLPPYASWIWDKVTKQYWPPVPEPEFDGTFWKWNEEKQLWEK